jgi:hypothetical protein
MIVLYCPGCGSPLEDIGALEDITEERTLYDCYCKRCGWSGDISPDRRDVYR